MSRVLNDLKCYELSVLEGKGGVETWYGKTFQIPLAISGHATVIEDAAKWDGSEVEFLTQLENVFFGKVKRGDYCIIRTISLGEYIKYTKELPDTCVS